MLALPPTAALININCELLLAPLAVNVTLHSYRI